MTHDFTSISPFLMACEEHDSLPLPQVRQPVYAKLPQVPKNASPVPHLTSLYHNADGGNYGSRSYSGNCNGNLIKDLLLFFRPDGIVFDPMMGSGSLV